MLVFQVPPPPAGHVQLGLRTIFVQGCLRVISLGLDDNERVRVRSPLNEPRHNCGKEVAVFRVGSPQCA